MYFIAVNQNEIQDSAWTTCKTTCSLILVEFYEPPTTMSV